MCGLTTGNKIKHLETGFIYSFYTFSLYNIYLDVYVAVSASVIIWVPKSGESKSGQMVSEEVIWS